MGNYHVPFWRAAALVRESLTLILQYAHLSQLILPLGVPVIFFTLTMPVMYP